MSLLEQLLPASFKGVSFLMMSSNISGGRKDVKHSFPNSNKQTIEDLGLSPKVFSISAVITGENYLQDRDRLLSALEQGGPGTLVHPMYGRLENYVARTYTLAENLTVLGEAKFSITFEIDDDVGAPVEALNTLNTISKANQAWINAVTTDIADNYSVSPSFANNFTSAADKMNDTVTAFEDSTSFIQASADEINEFTNQLATLESNILSLVQEPQALADSLTGVFASIDSLYPTVTATIDVLAGLFGFGDGDVQINTTTAILIERKKNNDILNNSMQGMALSYSYFNAVQKEFGNVNEIEATADDLEIQYQKVITADGLSDATKSSLTDLRLESQKFFDQQKLVTAQIITVDTNLTSARLLSFQYYGDSSLGEDLISLNNFDDVAFVEGDVQVLTQ